jgi:hypothetical protein
MFSRNVTNVGCGRLKEKPVHLTKLALCSMNSPVDCVCK